jgi:hypothetical protein
MIERIPADDAHQSPTMAARIDEVCDRFEAAWKAGPAPRLEDYLDSAHVPERTMLLRHLLAVELGYRRRRGERPTAHEYRHRFPRLEAAVDAAFGRAGPNVAREVRPSPPWLEPPELPPPGVTTPDSGGPPRGSERLPAMAEPSSCGAGPAPEEALTLSYVVATADGSIVPRWDEGGDRRWRDVFAPGIVLQGRYVLGRELGRGGMGRVYLARDERLDRPVAVKVLLASDPDRPDAADPSGRDREGSLLGEARIGANLTHSAIATVYDYGTHHEQPFTVFEYVPGETLRELLRRRGRLPLEDVRLIVGALAQALDCAHSHHIVHRDLKPENVRATGQGQFKVLDLGLAAQFRRHADWSWFCGTPAYASPEQAGGLACDGRTDQYALALITYELLTGRRVFDGSSWRALLEMHRDREPALRFDGGPNVPESVTDALARALEKDPNRRFATCEEFALAIGCQLLSARPPVPEILNAWLIRRMEGHRRSARPYRLRHRVYLALTPEALWSWHRSEIRRWPLGAVQRVEVAPDRADLRMDLATGGGVARQVFRFSSPHDAAQALDLIMKCREGLPPDTRRPMDSPDVEPVVVVRGRPEMRFQLLGGVEARCDVHWVVEAGLELRTAMMGADAVVDVHDERLPGFARTVRRVSGTAVCTLDQAGRHELGARQFAGSAARTALGLAVLTVLPSSFGSSPPGW